MKMKFQSKLVWLVVAGVLCVGGCRQTVSPTVSDEPTQPPCSLAQNGVSAYRIVLPPDASPSEKWAAGELASHLFEMTGAKFPVSKFDAAAPSIFVGPGPEAKRLCPDVNWNGLGDEGYVIRTVGRDLVLAGGRKRGSMYAVFGLLEDHLGCHWFTPDVKQVPRRETLELQAVSEKVLPTFEYRNVHNFNVVGPVWMARNRMNDCYGEHLPVAEAYGGKRYFYPFVHSLFNFVPPEKYFAEHPEYFSLTAGEYLIVGKFSDYPLWCIRLKDGKIETRLGSDNHDNICGVDGPALTRDAWRHVAVVFDRDGYMTRYVDGKVYGSPTDIRKFANVNLDTANRLIIGAGDDGRCQYFSGLFDEVRLYKRALSANEIAAMADANAQKADGAAACWSFNDGIDTAVVRDASTNRNDGVVHGCAWVPSSQDKAIHGGALRFDGRNDYVDCGDPANGSLDMGTGDFTVMARLKPDAPKRQPDAQLCLSNPEVVRITTEEVLKLCREKHPSVVSISQMDLPGGCCLCPTCSALDDREGTPAASIIRFVNVVAEKVEAEFPDVAIETLAYNYSLKAPKTIAPRRNVIVRLCTAACCFSHPLPQQCRKTNADFVEILNDWRRLTDRVYVWTYDINFAYPFLMFPNFHVIGPNMRFFRDMKVKGVFDEAGGGGNDGSGCIRMSTFHHVRAYVLAKLLWNPDYDTDKAINDFLEAFYGAAWRPLRAYLDLFTDRMKAEDAHMGCYEQKDVPHLSDADIQNAQQLFDQAQALVANDPVLLRRVRVERLSLDWLCLWRASRANAPRDAFITEVQRRFNAAVQELEPSHKKLFKAVAEFEKQWPTINK